MKLVSPQEDEPLCSFCADFLAKLDPKRTDTEYLLIYRRIYFQGLSGIRLIPVLQKQAQNGCVLCDIVLREVLRLLESIPNLSSEDEDISTQQLSLYPKGK